VFDRVAKGAATRVVRTADEEQGAAPRGKKSREQDKQTALVAAKGGAFDGTRCDDELLAQKRVLADQLGARTGQIGGEATRDARGPACVAKRPHHSFCKLDSRCGKLSEDAEHRAIRPKPRAIIKGLFYRRSRAIVWWRREAAKTADAGESAILDQRREEEHIYQPGISTSVPTLGRWMAW
jgi:hypothetical protein